jgi:hypothetical protein
MMDLEQLEEMMTEAPDAAQAEIARLVEQADVAALSRAAQSARVHELKLHAIDALAEVGGPEASDLLAGLLETMNTPLVRGGSEQQRQHAQTRTRLVQGLARMHNVRPPASRGEAEIAEFVAACREQ